MTNKFNEFIKSQSKNLYDDKETLLSLDKEKKLWLKKLSELYDLISKSLDSYVKSGDVKIIRSPITLSEEQLGSYEVDRLEIFLGRQVVHLKPIGTFLIGARGRVDMVGPKGFVRFVIVPPDLKKPSVKISISTEKDYDKLDYKSEYIPPEKWVWKISTLPPRIQYLELNSESFQDTLMGVVNGDS